MSGLSYLHDVVTLELDQEKCNACGICLKVCPHAVLVRNDSVVRIARRDACMECGACSRNCEPGAITVQAGVGCATALIGAALGGCSPGCC
ncbi:MAG TPA: mercury methylation ferredoxin HgcB [Myxococcota bacterium]|nr:mercury methylation ferredoxin HgcB [Myxococcota bacterium]